MGLKEVISRYGDLSAYCAVSAYLTISLLFQRISSVCSAKKQREKASNFRFCQFAASKQHDFLFVSPESRGVVVTVQRSCQRFRPFDSVFTASRSWRQCRRVGEQHFTVSRSWRASTSTSMQVDAAPISVFYHSSLLITYLSAAISVFFTILFQTFCPFLHFSARISMKCQFFLSAAKISW